MAEVGFSQNLQATFASTHSVNEPDASQPTFQSSWLPTIAGKATLSVVSSAGTGVELSRHSNINETQDFDTTSSVPAVDCHTHKRDEAPPVPTVHMAQSSVEEQVHCVLRQSIEGRICDAVVTEVGTAVRQVMFEAIAELHAVTVELWRLHISCGNGCGGDIARGQVADSCSNLHESLEKIRNELTFGSVRNDKKSAATAYGPLRESLQGSATAHPKHAWQASKLDEGSNPSPCSDLASSDVSENFCCVTATTAADLHQQSGLSLQDALNKPAAKCLASRFVPAVAPPWCRSSLRNGAMAAARTSLSPSTPLDVTSVNATNNIQRVRPPLAAVTPPANSHQESGRIPRDDHGHCQTSRFSLNVASGSSRMWSPRKCNTIDVTRIGLSRSVPPCPRTVSYPVGGILSGSLCKWPGSDSLQT